MFDFEFWLALVLDYLLVCRVRDRLVFPHQLLIGQHAIWRKQQSFNSLLTDPGSDLKVAGLDQLIVLQVVNNPAQCFFIHFKVFLLF
jgi:hypothetical protein